MNRAAYFKNDLVTFDSDMQDAILQWVHDKLFMSADSSVNVKFKDTTFGGSPGSSQYSKNNWDVHETTVAVRQLQVNTGAWAAAFTIDNPAGTGSLSGVSIDSFSISNTMLQLWFLFLDIVGLVTNNLCALLIGGSLKRIYFFRSI